LHATNGIVEHAPHMARLFSLGEGGGEVWGFFSPFAIMHAKKRCVDFVLQQECITNTCNTCKSEPMFDLDLAPYNLATYYLALVFHITCA
jgi:hypothetical protein